jgi:spore coat polysaccharide biosynthesis protein SpsF (cytidylyltransferase family)
MNAKLKRLGVQSSVAVLAPTNDPIISVVKGKCPIYTGPEDDVLERYCIACDEEQPDYLVRITSDCPLIPPWIISKMVATTIMGGYHYMNNVDEAYRTHPDGWDCEVISKRAMDWLRDHAVTPEMREHVTLLLRKTTMPFWITKGFMGASLDLSELKLSIDTQEDLERVREYYDKLAAKQAGSYVEYGKEAVHLV